MVVLRRWRVLLLLGCGTGAGHDLAAQVVTQEQALGLAFPATELSRHTAYLTATQVTQVADLAGRDADVEATVVTYYVARRDGVPVGVAYFDSHRVRTLPQVLMVVVAPDGRVRRVETVAFREPPEYRPPDGWLRRFDGRVLDDALTTKDDHPNLTGATLTARATARAVRRALALHAVIDPLRRAP